MNRRQRLANTLLLVATVSVASTSCSDVPRGMEVTFVNDTGRDIALVSIGASESFEEWRQRATYLPRVLSPGSESTQLYVGNPRELPESGEPWCLDLTVLHFVSPLNPDDVGQQSSGDQRLELDGLELDILAVDDAACFPAETGNSYSIQEAINEASS